MHHPALLLDITLDAVYSGLDRPAKAMISAGVTLGPFHWLWVARGLGTKRPEYNC